MYVYQFFCNKSTDERFKLFAHKQKEIMADTFKYLYENYPNQLKIEGWYEEAHQGEKAWRI